MNSCPQAEKVVDYYLDELTGREKDNFERHLKSCVICQQELQLEMAIQNELSKEFDPGFIESKIRARLEVRQVQDMGSFWMYAFRMAVHGIVAAVTGFVLIPFLLKPLLDLIGNVGKYTHYATELLSSLPQGNTLLIVLVVCSVPIFFASMYSLAQIRR